MNVDIRYLKLQATTGKHDLSGNYPIHEANTNENHWKLVHLDWSQTGTDLAVIDAAGRVAVYSLSMVAANQIVVSRTATVDAEDALSQSVGMAWLNPDRPVGIRPCASTND